MRSWKKVAGVFLFNLVVVWAVMEVVLRTPHFHYLKNYREKNNEPYKSVFFLDADNTYNINKKSQCKFIAQPEFGYNHCYNTAGLRDRTHSFKKGNKVKRYLALGDSFTEGLGAPIDSTWWNLLENKLNAAERDSLQHEFIGAGSMGGDICFSYHLLRNKLSVYQPDVVFYMLNYSDLLDISLRGGMERFTKDGKINCRLQSPWWEPAYIHSFVLRAFVHKVLGRDFLFRNKAQRLADDEYSKRQICVLVDSMNKYCQSINARFVLIVQPLAPEIIDNLFTMKTVNSYCRQKGTTCIDLFNFYNALPHDSAVALINKYYWPVDGHCKPAGYNFMAGEIFKHAGEW